MSETLRIKVIDAMSQGRKIHIDQIEAVEALIEQEVIKGKIEELQHVDRHTNYYPTGSPPIEAQERISELQSKQEGEIDAR